MKNQIYSKEQILTIISILILFAAALIDWSIYSWLILLAIILLLIAWYSRK